MPEGFMAQLLKTMKYIAPAEIFCNSTQCLKIHNVV